MSSDIVRVSISVPVGLLAEFDEEIEAAGYGSRSEAIRAAMMLLIQQIRKRR